MKKISTQTLISFGILASLPCLLLANAGIAAPDTQVRHSSAAEDQREPQTQTQTRTTPTHAHWGLIVDLGAPDLAGLGVLVRPLRWLRLHASASTNGMSFGLRGGATWVPFHYWISPSLTIEGGHFFEGNANRLTGLFGVESDALERVSYSFGNAHAGFELGNPDGFAMFVHAGISVVAAKLSSTQNDLSDAEDSTPTSMKAPGLTYVGPSGKLGVVVHF